MVLRICVSVIVLTIGSLAVGPSGAAAANQCAPGRPPGRPPGGPPNEPPGRPPGRPPQYPPGRCQLRVSSASVPAGSSISVEGSGNDPGSAVVLSFGPTPAGRATAASDGRFSRSLSIPADAPPGPYKLRATGFAGGLPYEQAASVEVVATSGAGPVSANVGSGVALPGTPGSVAADAPATGQVLGGAVSGSRSSDGGWVLLATAAGVVLVGGGAGAFVAGRRRKASRLTPP